MNNSYFSFNNKYYLQISGMPMGSPLSPILANIIMDFCLDNILKVLPFKFSFIHKYVDDIICALPECEISSTLDIFNSFHPNIQYTIEVEVDRSVPFLDTKVCRDDKNNILIDWYRKPTNSGRFLNYYSNHPIKQKINLVLAMKDRVTKISHPSLLHNNLRLLSQSFVNNGYPKYLVQKLLYNTPTLSRPTVANDAAGESGRVIKYFRFPYIHMVSERISRTIASESIKFGFYNCNPIRRYFSKLKDKTNTALRSNVIYSIPCRNCEQVYIGQTSTWLKTRISTHKSDINTKKERCALSLHINKNKHTANFDNVKIIRSVKNKKSREFLEMVEISKNNNAMNFRSDISGLSSMYAFLLSMECSDPPNAQHAHTSVM